MQYLSIIKLIKTNQILESDITVISIIIIIINNKKG